MDYEQAKNYLIRNPRCKINFKEYAEDMSGHKREILRIEGCEVINFFNENEFLDRKKVSTYYGDEVIYEDFCTYPYLRIVIKVPDSKDIFTDSEEKNTYVIHLNKAYFNSNLQEIDLYQDNKDPSNALGAIKPWDWLILIKIEQK